jgi:NADPH-dependent curcumin reductase CurA
MALGKLLADGKLRYRTDIVDGLENALAAFGRLFSGDKTGKLLLRVSEEPPR